MDICEIYGHPACFAFFFSSRCCWPLLRWQEMRDEMLLEWRENFVRRGEVLDKKKGYYESVGGGRLAAV